MSQTYHKAVDELERKLTHKSSNSSLPPGVESITEHGASNGDDATDELLSVFDALDNGIAYVPPGEYGIDERITIPEGILIRGAGPHATRIRSDDSSTHTTFSPESYSGISHLTIDQNTADRGLDKSNGVMLREADHCTFNNLRFENISVSAEGTGIYLDCQESHDQGIHNIEILNSHFEGSWHSGDNNGDFLIRARTNFKSDKTADEFENFIYDNLIAGSTFTGKGKSAIELVGPATVHNGIKWCTAREFETCVGIFEASLGAKDNTIAHSDIVDCYGDSTCIGFYADGRSVPDEPPRRSENNHFIDDHVNGFHQINEDNEIRAFRVRRDDGSQFRGCTANNITASRAGKAQAWNIADSTNTVIDSCGIANVDVAFDFSNARLPRINTPTLHNVNQFINKRNEIERPRWNGTIGGGLFGGVDLTQSQGYYEGDDAIDENSGLPAWWHNGAWKRSDGKVIQ